MKMKKWMVRIGAMVLLLLVLSLFSPGPNTPAPGTMVTLENGHKVNVFEAGSGPDVVLVHGFPGSAYDWADTPEKLAAKGYHVISYDRVGYGYSSRRRGGESHSIAQNAADLEQLIKAMDLQNPVLVGWSYGGGVVQVNAASDPQEIKAIVLLAAIGPALELRDLPSTFSLQILAWGFRQPVIGWPFAKAVLTSIFPETLPEAWLRNQHALFPVKGSIKTMSAEGRDMDVSELGTSTIIVPTLIVQGEKDQNVAFGVATDLQDRIKGSEMKVLTDAAHMLPVSHADVIASLIDEFVQAQNTIQATPAEPK